MRGIFMAQGPRFRADGAVLPWIRLVDEYQVRENEKKNNSPYYIDLIFKKENNKETTTLVPVG